MAARSAGTLAALTVLVLALLVPQGVDAQSAPSARGLDRACSAEAQGFRPFADVDRGTHADAIGCVAYFGVTRGVQPDRYDPTGRVTREQMASFVARWMNRVDGFRLEEHPPQHFRDSIGPHGINIDRLAQAGVVEGRDDGTYDRGSWVSRQQMASFVVRAIETITGEPPPREHPFTDEDRISEAHRDNVAKLAGARIVEGRADGTYGPQVAVSRQEMASFLARALDYLAEAGFSSTPQTPEFPQALATFDTPLQPGQDRNQNIHRAADILHGQRIEPGERFSLDQRIGPRTRERGFTTNGYIDGDGEIRSVVGGGVSQVATTMMNTAWFSGIGIVSHQPHSQYFERYPPGREATIDWQSIDLVLENDTPFPITIRASYSSSHVAFTLVGTPWGRTTSSWLDAPGWASTGDAFNARYGRTVTYPDGTSNSESYSHTYEQPPE